MYILSAKTVIFSNMIIESLESVGFLENLNSLDFTCYYKYKLILKKKVTATAIKIITLFALNDK